MKRDRRQGGVGGKLFIEILRWRGFRSYPSTLIDESRDGDGGPPNKVFLSTTTVGLEQTSTIICLIPR